MGVELHVQTRDGEEARQSLADGHEVVFGRAGHPGTVVVSTSDRVSRTAFVLRAEPEGLVRARCQQRQGTLEVKRPDGRVAGSLDEGEEGLFRVPVQILLHTTAGAQVRVFVQGDRPAAPTAPRPTVDAGATVTTGWSVALIQAPPAGRDWVVAAALAALLLRRGRRSDPAYTVPRGVLLRTCGVWLGAPKSEGWLASKFRQASEALAVPFGSNPSQQLGEYVLANHLLTDAGFQVLDAELDRRRRGGGPSAPLPRR